MLGRCLKFPIYGNVYQPLSASIGALVKLRLLGSICRHHRLSPAPYPDAGCAPVDRLMLPARYAMDSRRQPLSIGMPVLPLLSIQVRACIARAQPAGWPVLGCGPWSVWPFSFGCRPGDRYDRSFRNGRFTAATGKRQSHGDPSSGAFRPPPTYSGSRTAPRSTMTPHRASLTACWIPANEPTPIPMYLVSVCHRAEYGGPERSGRPLPGDARSLPASLPG